MKVFGFGMSQSLKPFAVLMPSVFGANGMPALMALANSLSMDTGRHIAGAQAVRDSHFHPLLELRQAHAPVSL